MQPDCASADLSSLNPAAWAERRGYKTAKAARNDVYRAANSLLRLAIDGRLCLCLRPPGYSSRRGESPSTDPLPQHGASLFTLREGGGERGLVGGVAVWVGGATAGVGGATVEVGGATV